MRTNITTLVAALLLAGCSHPFERATDPAHATRGAAAEPIVTINIVPAGKDVADERQDDLVAFTQTGAVGPSFGLYMHLVNAGYDPQQPALGRCHSPRTVLPGRIVWFQEGAEWIAHVHLESVPQDGDTLMKLAVLSFPGFWVPGPSGVVLDSAVATIGPDNAATVFKAHVGVPSVFFAEARTAPPDSLRSGTTR